MIYALEGVVVPAARFLPQLIAGAATKSGLSPTSQLAMEMAKTSIRKTIQLPVY